MKNTNIFKFLSLAALTVGMSACSDNYLNVNPTTDVGQPEVTATVENAQMGINGICRSMQTQYSGTSYNQYNGESYINTWLSEGMGPDNVVALSISSFGADNLLMKTISNQGYVSVYLPWQYCYNLITQANVIIDGIDNASGDEDHRNFVKAQALTFRAFGYTKLLQFYAPRWEDSNNGEAYCVVLRLKPGTEPVPLAKMKDVLAQIYSDLDTAVELFNGSSYIREHKWQPDGSVACGVYARAALIKHDWAKAQQMLTPPAKAIQLWIMTLISPASMQTTMTSCGSSLPTSLISTTGLGVLTSLPTAFMLRTGATALWQSLWISFVSSTRKISVSSASSLPTRLTS